MHFTFGAAEPMLLVNKYCTLIVMLLGVMNLSDEAVVAQLDVSSNLQPGRHVHVDELRAPSYIFTGMLFKESCAWGRPSIVYISQLTAHPATSYLLWLTIVDLRRHTVC